MIWFVTVVQRWIRLLYSGITLRTKEANAVPQDVMRKWCVSDGGLIYSPASLLNKPSLVINCVARSKQRSHYR